jgi:hypothetical protein
MKMIFWFCAGWIILGILHFVWYFISRDMNYIIGSLAFTGLGTFVFVCEKMLDYRK